MQATIVRLIQVHANNIVFTLKIRLSLYKITYYLHFLMLTFHLYKIIFFTFLCFSIFSNVYPKYCQNYKCLLMKSETLSLKIIKNKLDFLKKTVIIHCTA